MPDPGLTIRRGRVALRSTREDDLPSTLALWNDGRVMRWVGFPEGLGYDEEKIRNWHGRLRESVSSYHFSVYSDEIGYCGEVFCHLDRPTRRASLDIKFVVEAQGKGLSRQALLALIDWVFETLEETDAVWTEPWPANLAARTLYYSCGMREKERPAGLREGPSYWELRREDWKAAR